MLEITEVSPGDEVAWEEFLEQSGNGTLFHSLRFLSYHGPGNADRRPLMFRDSGRILALLPGAFLEKEGARVFVSPWGGSFGGWVLSGGEDYDGVSLLVDGLLEWCRQRGVQRIDLTPPPFFYLREPDQLVEIVLLSRGFQRFGTEMTDVIRLSGDPEKAREVWHSSARKGVRKAASSGVVVSESGDLETFYPILSENRARRGVVPTHTMEDLRRLVDLVPERMILLVAARGEDIIGGTLLFVCNPRVVMNFYLCHLEEAQAWRPADALLAAGIKAAANTGAAYFDLGTSSMDGTPNFGLHRFKSKFGARPFLRESYRLELQRHDS